MQLKRVTFIVGTTLFWTVSALYTLVIAPTLSVGGGSPLFPIPGLAFGLGMAVVLTPATATYFLYLSLYGLSSRVASVTMFLFAPCAGIFLFGAIVWFTRFPSRAAANVLNHECQSRTPACELAVAKFKTRLHGSPRMNPLSVLPREVASNVEAELRRFDPAP